MADFEPNVSHFDLRPYGNLAISIVADSHGQIDPRILEVIAESDVAIHAGDILGVSVLESMRPRSGMVIAVRGNNDSQTTWPGSQNDKLKQIPDVATLSCPGGMIVVEHGHSIDRIEQNHYPLAYKHSQARAVVYGHTHLQRLDQDSLPWLVNPGAAGITRNNGGASCYLLRIKAHQWTMESYKFTPFRKAG
jgi:putative phosphoesterase